MALPTQLGFGGTGFHGDDAVRTRTSINSLVTLATEVKTDHNALLTKLDADTPGVADTNYASLRTIAAATPSAVSASVGLGGSLFHGDGAVQVRTTLEDLRTLINEAKADHNALRTKLAADGTVNDTDYAQATATNEQQTITVDATGGTYTITWSGQTTTAISATATAATVKAALEGLSNIAVGDVTVTGGPGDAGGTTPYTVTFTGNLAATNVAAMTTTTSLTGGAGTAVVATSVPGVAPLIVVSADVGAIPVEFGRGGSREHGDQAVALKAIIDSMIDLLNEIKAKHNLLLAKLDADTGVTDTNYASLQTVSAADAA